MLKPTVRRSMLAIAAVIAAAAATLIPAGASAQAPAAQQSTSLAECTSWTNIFKDGGAWWVQVPSVGYLTGQLDCTLQKGSSKSVPIQAFQTAISGCYPQIAEIGNELTFGVFDANMEQAVKELQSLVGVTPDGTYGPAIRDAINWLHYDGMFASARCFPLLAPAP